MNGRKITTQTPQTPRLGKVVDAICQVNGIHHSKPMWSYTEITGTIPQRLTKIIGLTPEGDLRKESAANLTSGTCRRLEVADLQEFSDHLDRLTSANALVFGISTERQATLCTNDNTEALSQGAIARTRENFSFPKGSGIMMLDHDGLPDGSLTLDEFRMRLLKAVPVLATASMLGRPSASAGCMHPDGHLLTPLNRHRLYIPVKDASLIPEAGKALAQLLWATPGDGWIEIGKAGQALARCLVDTSVWQPERLDFAGPPVLVDGVTRPKVDSVIFGQQDGLFDLRLLIASLTNELIKKAEAAQNAAKIQTKPQCAEQAKAWAEQKAPELAKKRNLSVEQAKTILQRASQHYVLMGDYELLCADGSTVTVSQLLDNPQLYHATHYADPLDPDDDWRVATAFLQNGSRPIIYSHRHGGMSFELRRQSERVQIGTGLRIETTDATLRVLSDRGELFDYGDQDVVYVANQKIKPVTAEWLLDHMGRVIDFYKVKSSSAANGEVSCVEIPQDAPAPVASAIMAKHGSRNFRRLEAICTAPILRSDGSILDTPGYDQKTGFLYVTQELSPPKVPEEPTIEDALLALEDLWYPFHKFPLDDSISTGVLLSALLSAVLRPCLSTCPAYGFDAPAAGSGKTLLGRCIATLSCGKDVPVMPPAKDEEEWRKRLFSGLRGGDSVLLVDNVRDPIGNAAIDSFITSASFKDRVLGESNTLELPNKALFLMTGNNLVLTGDTHRRVLLVRIDSKQERPYTREFEFNPLDVIMEQRQQMVVAALTIVRAYIVAGQPRPAKGRIASFELWDDLVRQPLCWLRNQYRHYNTRGLPIYDDPLESIKHSEADNPETAKLEAMLSAWHHEFQSEPKSVAEVIAFCEQNRLSAVLLNDAVTEVAGQRGHYNSRILGRWIERNKNVRRTGLRFVQDGISHNVKLWKVIRS